jgi:hypothetical protein
MEATRAGRSTHHETGPGVSHVGALLSKTIDRAGT